MAITYGMVQSAVARGLAVFLGGFTVLNIVGSWWAPGFDANGWWIDVGFMPWRAGHVALILAAVALLWVGVGWPQVASGRGWANGAMGALISVTTWNTFMFYWGWFWGNFTPGVKVPLSMVLGMVLGFVLRVVWKGEKGEKGEVALGRVGRGIFAGTVGVAMVAFPIAQMYCFGKTDYTRNADAIVVFGAKANADGTPSQALEDRVRTGIALYKAGRARVLIFSGGPGAGALSEPEAMRNVALAEGVPASAMVLDEKGLNTDATVDNTVVLFKERGIKKVLAVSHDYHLPRVKMTYERALVGSGVEVFTVPAKERRPLTGKPYFMAREVAALWVYYLRPLWGG